MLPTTICSYEPCSLLALYRGYCERHHRRNKRNGDPGIALRHFSDCDCRTCLGKPANTKRCGGYCGQFKPLSAFTKVSTNPIHGRSYQCIECARLKQIERKYGLPREAYCAMLQSQGNVCAVCPAINAGGPWNTWYVDHDHSCCAGEKTCGKCIRGLLCFKCNVLLGMAQDDVAVLQSAISYLTDRR